MVGIALLLLMRAAHWHLARRGYVVCLLFAFCTTPYFRAPTAPLTDLIINHLLVLPLGFGLSFWNLNESLPGVRLWGRGYRVVTWALALLLSASFAAVYWSPDAELAAISNGLALGGIVLALLVASTRVYQRADPLGRRQIKWALYGFYVGELPFCLFNAVVALGVVPEWTSALLAVANVAFVAMPLGFLVAVAFYQFLDIDRLFSATLRTACWRSSAWPCSA
jgi:hypothetical protein